MYVTYVGYWEKISEEAKCEQAGFAIVFICHMGQVSSTIYTLMAK